MITDSVFVLMRLSPRPSVGFNLPLEGRLVILVSEKLEKRTTVQRNKGHYLQRGLQQTLIWLGWEEVAHHPRVLSALIAQWHAPRRNARHLSALLRQWLWEIPLAKLHHCRHLRETPLVRVPMRDWRNSVIKIVKSSVSKKKNDFVCLLSP